jgi:hypothetical protein
VLVVQRFTLGTIPEWRKCRLGMAIAYGAEKIIKKIKNNPCDYSEIIVSLEHES